MERSRFTATGVPDGVEEGAESLGLGTVGSLAPPPSLVSNEDSSGDLTAPVSHGILLEASTVL